MPALLARVTVSAAALILATSSYAYSPPALVDLLGEEIVYKVRWQSVPVGSAKLACTGLSQLWGREVIGFSLSARTEGFFSRLFTVDDRIETYLDQAVGLPLRFEKHLREGRYRNDTVTDFQRESGAATVRGKVIPIPRDTVDSLSALVLLRTRELTPGQSHFFPLYSGRTFCQLEVQVKDRERLQTVLGSLDVLRIEPLLTYEGRLFDARAERMTVWLTDDSLRLPVKIVTHTKWGRITAVIERIAEKTTP